MFNFINYCTPIWHFNFVAKQQINYYIPNYKTLPEKYKELITLDKNYTTYHATLLDAGYQALKKGIILNQNDTTALKIKGSYKNVSDNYRFVKKYYGKFWVLYVFIIRIVSLYNPVSEIMGLISCLKIKRLDIYAKVFTHDLENFKSTLVQAKPMVSVIIPTLNRYAYLQRCITDLENQTYKNFELIVVDQSDEFKEEFYENRKIKIKLIRQESKKLWKARNDAIRLAAGEHILLYDDDSIVESNWIEKHLACIDYFKVRISSGVSLAAFGSKIPKNYAYYRWADQIDTGNVLIHKSVFKEIGLFDEQFEGMRLGDGEFGFRAFNHSVPIVSNPEAFRIHLKVETGGLRQMGSWDAFRPTKIFAPKPIPSVIYFFKRYLPPLNYRMTIFTGLILSNISYKNKKSNNFLLLSIAKSVLLLPILVLQYYISYKKASKMIVAGPKINLL